MTKTLQFIVTLALPLVLASCNGAGSKPERVQAPTLTDTIQRGEYLVTTMGCNDCHSPKQMGPHGPDIISSKLLSGYPADRPLPPVDKNNLANGWVMLVPDLTAAAGPWGISFAANLTPDETGIGNWNFEQFKKALTQGKFKGLDNGRMLLPPMPWTNFISMKEEDLKAMYVYLRSIPPVRNSVPEPLAPARE